MPKPVASLRLLIALVALVLVLQVAFAVVLWCLIPMPAERGLFGDMFGAVNASFSGLAFAGIVYTIHAQRAESSFNAAAAERSARLSALSALVAAYAERSEYIDSHVSSDTSEIQSIQTGLKKLIVKLEAEIERSETEA